MRGRHEKKLVMKKAEGDPCEKKVGWESSVNREFGYFGDLLTSLSNAPQKGRKGSFLFYQFNFVRFLSPVIAAEPLFSLVFLFHPKMERGFRLKFKALLLEIQVRFITKRKKEISQKMFFKCQTATQYSFMFILTQSTPWVLCKNSQSRFSPSENFIDGRRLKPFFIAAAPHIAM